MVTAAVLRQKDNNIYLSRNAASTVTLTIFLQLFSHVSLSSAFYRKRSYPHNYYGKAVVYSPYVPFDDLI